MPARERILSKSGHFSSSESLPGCPLSDPVAGRPGQTHPINDHLPLPVFQVGRLGDLEGSGGKRHAHDEIIADKLLNGGIHRGGAAALDPLVSDPAIGLDQQVHVVRAPLTNIVQPVFRQRIAAGGNQQTQQCDQHDSCFHWMFPLSGYGERQA